MLSASPKHQHQKIKTSTGPRIFVLRHCRAHWRRHPTVCRTCRGKLPPPFPNPLQKDRIWHLNIYFSINMTFKWKIACLCAVGPGCSSLREIKNSTFKLKLIAKCETLLKVKDTRITWIYLKSWRCRNNALWLLQRRRKQNERQLSQENQQNIIELPECVPIETKTVDSNWTFRWGRCQSLSPFNDKNNSVM